MKKYEELSYPEKGACGLFQSKIVRKRILMPRLKITWIASFVLGVALWISCTTFWVALAASLPFALAVTVIVIMNSYSYDQKFFERNPKRFLYWQEQYLYTSISVYQRMKKDHPAIMEDFQSIADLSGLSAPGRMLIKGINNRNAAYLAMFKWCFYNAQMNYKKTLKYFSENNITPPLVT
jgi:hypothetical protein